MSALEIALSNLQAECTMIANKRSEIVQTVMEQQYETVISVKEVREGLVCLFSYIMEHIHDGRLPPFCFVAHCLFCILDHLEIMNQLLEQTENDDPYSSRDDIVDENWESLIHSLEHQTKLGRTGTSIGTPMALSPPKTS